MCRVVDRRRYDRAMRRFYLAGLLAVAACGGGGTELSGLYMIDAWNQNPSSCADPGASMLGSASDKVFYIKSESVFGSDFVNVKACADRATCEAEAADDSTINISSNFGTFEQGNDDDGWTETDAYGFPSTTTPGQCDGTGTRSSLTADGADAVTIRIERVSITFPAVTGADECPDEDAIAAAEGRPCEELSVIHGTQIGDI